MVLEEEEVLQKIVGDSYMKTSWKNTQNIERNIATDTDVLDIEEELAMD